MASSVKGIREMGTIKFGGTNDFSLHVQTTILFFYIRLFGPIGFYGIGKYLYAQKKPNNIKVIDFSEGIILLGFTINFSL